MTKTVSAAKQKSHNLVVRSIDDVPELLRLAAALKCADATQCIPHRTQNVLEQLAHWWLTDVSCKTECATWIEAGPTNDLPMSNAGVTFWAQIKSERRPVILMMLQHQTVDVHEQIQVPHGELARRRDPDEVHDLVQECKDTLKNYRQPDHRNKILVSIPLRCVNPEQQRAEIQTAVETLVTGLCRFLE